MEKQLADKIRMANVVYHDKTASTYEESVSYTQSKHAERMFELDISRICEGLGHKSGKMFLDVGSGTGFLTLKFLERGFHCVAVDISAAMCSELQCRAEAAGYIDQLEVIKSDIDEFLARDSRVYDVIGFCSVLHHLPDYVYTLSLASQRVASNGHLYTVVDPIKMSARTRSAIVLSLIDSALFKMQRNGVWWLVRRLVHSRSNPGRDPLKELMPYVEYHALQEGVDEGKVQEALLRQGFLVNMEFHSLCKTRLMHAISSMLGIKTNVKVVAQNQVDKIS